MRKGVTIPRCNVPVLWINDARIKRRFCIWKRGEPPSIYFFKASYFLKLLFRTKNQTLVKVNIKNNIQKRDTIRYTPLPCFEKQTVCISYWHLYNWISIFQAATIYCIRSNYQKAEFLKTFFHADAGHKQDCMFNVSVDFHLCPLF